MAVDRRMLAGHSPDFVAAWRSILCGVYRWRQDGRFAVVPSLLGGSTLAYLPLLSYSDLSAAEAKNLAREVAGRSFNIRALSAQLGDERRPQGASSVFRIDLAAFGHNIDALWMKSLHRVRRKGVRRALNAGLEASEETGLAAFRQQMIATYAGHGVPIMPTALFAALMQDLDARILVVRNRSSGASLASLLWLRDGPLAWVPWSGGRHCPENPNDLLFWSFIKQALADGVDIVDFGSSPMGSGAHRFKQEFGATPIPLLRLSDKPTDLHSRYELPQKIWRILPRMVTNSVGPWLCRYLADY